MVSKFSIRSVALSSLIGASPLLFLLTISFLWEFSQGSYTENQKLFLELSSLMTIIGAPFAAGYIAARNSIRFRYVIGIISVLIVFIIAKFVPVLEVELALTLMHLETKLPESIQANIPDSVLFPTNFYSEILLLTLFFIFGVAGVACSKKCKNN